LDKTQHPLLGPSTIKPTLIKGGFKSNVIPDLCEVTLNVRPIPGHDRREVVEGWVNDIIRKRSEADPTFRAELTGLRVSEALDILERSEVVQLLMDLLGTRPEGAAYYTEAVSYTRAGIPTVICGPGDIAQAHAPDEFISLEQLDRGTALYKRLIERVCL
jgi:acetylornithine deacetylase